MFMETWPASIGPSWQESERMSPFSKPFQGGRVRRKALVLTDFFCEVGVPTGFSYQLPARKVARRTVKGICAEL